MTRLRTLSRSHTGAIAVLAALLALSLPVTAAQADTPAAKSVIRSAALPAEGLFVGDRLSPAAQERLAALAASAGDLDVEVAFVSPSGAWKTEGDGERSLTPARLQAVRDFLSTQGVDGRRIYVESRIDPKARAAQLQVELVGRPAP
jgi:OOP family OmpA-OmpF porin